MKLSKAMAAELSERLKNLSATQQEDPAFRDIPRSDRYLLAAIFVSSLIAVALIGV